MSDSLFNRELSRGKHAGCLLTRKGPRNFNNLHLIHFSLYFKYNTENLTMEKVDIDVSVITISVDSLRKLVYNRKSRLRNVSGAVILGYKECQNLLLKADIYEAFRM